MFGKGRKKLDRKMRRRIRKTSAVMLLISAITVAAIPVPEAMAAPANIVLEPDVAAETYSVTAANNNEIPKVEATGETFYRSEGGTFTFVHKDTGLGSLAVLLNCVCDASIKDLNIPESVNAYTQYTTTDGSSRAFAAANKSGGVLYYRESRVVVRTRTTSKTYEQTDTMPDNNDSDWGPWGGNTLPNYETDHGDKNVSSIVSNYDANTKKWTQTCAYLEYRFRPCVLGDESIWKHDTVKQYVCTDKNGIGINWQNMVFYQLPNGITNADDILVKNTDYTYEDGTNNSKFRFPKDDNENWLVNVRVGYISDQRTEMKNNVLSLITTNAGDGIPTDTEKKSFFYADGVNSGGSIQTVKFPTSLISIADYAFNGCTSLQSVSFAEPANPAESSAISAIGHHAFANCSSMVSFMFPSNTRATTLANSVFENCQGLQKFEVPVNITKICDSAFKNCSSLETVDFSKAVNLNTFGSGVFENCIGLGGNERIVLPINLSSMGKWNFKGCTSLKEVQFSERSRVSTLFSDGSGGTKQENVSLSNFAGCTSLERIDVLSKDTTFAFKADNNQGDYYSYDGTIPSVNSFKTDVGDEFYFAGYSDGRIHDMTKSEAIAFLYLDKTPPIYEKVIREYKKDANGNDTDELDVQYTYQVNPDGELLGIEIVGKPETVVVEDKIGPHNVTKIGSEFSNGGRGNKDLISITIPSTIVEIGDNAFKGCSNLREVIFVEPNRIKLDGIGIDAFKTQEGAGGTEITDDNRLVFYGDIRIDSEPFKYAMKEGNYFTNSSQKKEYIDFCSGDGTNIHVKYNETTQLRELQKVPTTDIAKAGLAPGASGDQVKDDYYKTLRKEMLKMSIYDESNVDNALKQAVTEYDENGAASVALSDEALRILKTAFDITLPSGIQSIKSGLFSEANEENTTTTISGNDPIRIPADKEYIGPDIFRANTSVRNIVMDDIEDLEPYTFYGCENLESIRMYSSEKEEGETIGDYAFAHCPNLISAKLPVSTVEMGKRPFAADKKLTGIEFLGESPAGGGDPSQNTGENFSCNNGIIFGLENGVKDTIIQCLEARGSFDGGIGSSDIEAEELAGINSIAEEAFMNCKDVELIDLTDSNVTFIPTLCFNDASRLENVSLPATCTRVDDYSFKDTALRRLRVPNMMTRFGQSAFYDTNAPAHVKHDVEVRTMEGSSAAALVKTYEKYRWRLGALIKMTCTTVFQDKNGNEIASHRNEEGEEVEEPTEQEWTAYFEKYPEFKDMVFVGWIPEKFSPASKEENYVTATFSDEVIYYHVRFVNDNLSVLMEDDVLSGKRTPVPQTPTSAQNPGATFRGWLSDPQGQSPYDPITCDVTFMASYGSGNGGDQSGNNPNDPNNPNNPNNPGNGNGNGNGDGSNSNNSNKARYTLTVVNGSGGGTYDEGTTVVVSANTPNTGYEFYNWTSSESDTNFTSKTLASTSFTMPKKNLTVTANYRTKSETNNGITSRRTPGTVTSAPSSNTGSVSKSDGSDKNNNNSGSSVQVSRPGISDTNVASATVNGSTDNFVIKVTEDGQATMAVAEALRNEYGSLDNIHYFAMDISLYDETGTTKITDTSGISVTITLPIPDELRQYAGNNKVAAVTGGNNLDKLNPRFTTVNGVPCVTFTATHFSPYTVYVDTANLSEGAFDTTPKTGDAIHPKWFLAIGLGLFSAVLFLKKDKKMRPETA